jgi:hypothetical protein
MVVGPALWLHVLTTGWVRALCPNSLNHVIPQPPLTSLGPESTETCNWELHPGIYLLTQSTLRAQVLSQPPPPQGELTCWGRCVSI